MVEGKKKFKPGEEFLERVATKLKELYYGPKTYASKKFPPTGEMSKLPTEKTPKLPTENIPKLLKVTAYCPCKICCGKFSDNITASGHKIKAGDRFVAAPGNIPFGTELEIPGYGVVPVLDRGGSIKGNKLDVFFPTHKQALQWGVKHLKVKQK